MDTWMQRTKTLLGADAVSRLHDAHIIVFGLGGVGSFAAEALARCGVGALTVVDADTVSESNINRQLYALHSTVGENKTEVAKKRILDINPDCNVRILTAFYDADKADAFFDVQYDFCLDAIDTVSSKISLVEQCKKRNIPLISCMGTGNKLHAEKLQISKLSKTNTCPLCRVMRRELKNRNLGDITVVWSDEEPRSLCVDDSNGRHAPASIAFVPPVAGFLLAEYAVLQLTQTKD
ncbi:MAG: tRNA threonylcarbamoyladenosine dehydratase [Ruminococcaceae bacterium]|nr:tRNA threonylcarbamoyladenosine dehydratase [Oscillospiraceae bacterium]